ncbi:hypothetical protein [Paraburkholderia dipogonis]
MKPSVSHVAALVTTLIKAYPEPMDGAIDPLHAATQHAASIRAAAASA